MDNLDVLWMKRRGLVEKGKLLDQRWNDAEARLPQWARSGPRCIDWKGNPCGEVVHWPAIDVGVPDRGVLRVARIGPDELSSRYDFNMRSAPHQAAVWKSGYRKALRALVLRRRAQRAEETRVALPALDRELQANFDKQLATERRIQKAATICGGGAAAAAVALIELSRRAAFATLGDKYDLRIEDCDAISKTRREMHHLQIEGTLSDDVRALVEAPCDMKVRELPFVTCTFLVLN